LPVAGGRIKPGRLQRSDDVTTVPVEWAVDLVAEGVVATIDLRSAAETILTGPGPLPRLGVAYHWLPLIADVRLDATLPSQASPDEVGHWYADLVEINAQRLATAFQVVADNSGGVLFHCTIGKDRTGILAALLLSALGASDAVIAADYQRTEANLAALYNRAAGLIGALLNQPDGRTPKLLIPAVGSALRSAPEASIIALLNHLRRRHGQVLGPLLDAGLTPVIITELRQQLVIADA
jgi:hypothetical protein